MPPRVFEKLQVSMRRRKHPAQVALERDSRHPGMFFPTPVNRLRDSGLAGRTPSVKTLVLDMSPRLGRARSPRLTSKSKDANPSANSHVLGYPARLIAPEFAEGFGFLCHSVFAKLTIIPVCCGVAFLESFDFAVNVCKHVCVRLFCHDVSPQT